MTAIAPVRQHAYPFPLTASMTSRIALLLACLLISPGLRAGGAAMPDLAALMAEPAQWVGAAVEQPSWQWDGQALVYRTRRAQGAGYDHYRVALADGRSVALDAAAQSASDPPAPVYDGARRRSAFLRHGDVFVRDLASGDLQQYTRGAQLTAPPLWRSDDAALLLQVDARRWAEIDLNNGRSSLLVEVRSGRDPELRERDALAREQLHLFDTLRQRDEEREAQRAEQLSDAQSDASRAALPIYLGSDTEIVASALSPDGAWLLVVGEPKDDVAGKQPQVMRYVTDSGYPETQRARPYVGRNPPSGQSFWLVDLRTRRVHALDFDRVPGVRSDPLAALRNARIAALEREGRSDEAHALAASERRALRLLDDDQGASGAPLRWQRQGEFALLLLRAVDNKDRWLLRLDPHSHALDVQHRLTDAAWINWRFNEFGLLPDGRTLWYLSEQDGHSRLYLKPLGGAPRALSGSGCEASSVQASADGRWLYFRANPAQPWRYDLYRVAVAGGAVQQVSRYGSLDDYAIAPDGARVAVLHSSAYLPPQLAVLAADGHGVPQELTDTRLPAYRALRWSEPHIVQVPGRHGQGRIAAKLYLPEAPTAQLRPAVLFVHGAGYLQNVTLGWPSYYFREQFFHNWLLARGYVVLDMDYRASAGYGRAWRTAIYRDMGHPELEDLLDGRDWLLREHGVDPRRVLIYGGSYGGFMTLMALLRAPGQFAAGAALRPVSDWLSYNHEYTSNILDDPRLDPEAYRRSSPITHAAALRDPLLIAHGLLDDNVLPDDSIRLYQRLIELGKRDFWISLYPLERHGFQSQAAWADEYRRIAELFEHALQREYTARD